MAPDVRMCRCMTRWAGVGLRSCDHVANLGSLHQLLRHRYPLATLCPSFYFFRPTVPLLPRFMDVCI